VFLFIKYFDGFLIDGHTIDLNWGAFTRSSNIIEVISRESDKVEREKKIKLAKPLCIVMSA